MPEAVIVEALRSPIGRGKPIYWATGAMHSPETGSPEMLMELVYRLAVDESPFVREIRDNLIFMTTPVLDVDGRDKRVDLLELGRVFDRKAVRRDEIAERVVAGGVATRPPLDVDVLLPQARHAAHHVVDAEHVVGDVVEAGRPRQEGDPVVPFVAAQEGHEVAEPVADLEAEHVGEELHRRLVVRRVHDDVHRHRSDRLR